MSRVAQHSFFRGACSLNSNTMNRVTRDRPFDSHAAIRATPAFASRDLSKTSAARRSIAGFVAVQFAKGPCVLAKAHHVPSDRPHPSWRALGFTKEDQP